MTKPIVLLSAIMLGAIGCSDDTAGNGGAGASGGGDPACLPGQLVLPDGSCQQGSLPDLACAPGEVPNEAAGSRCCPAGSAGLADGTCRPAGVDGSACPEGFVGSVDGCEPQLPSEPCPLGTMALPGETTCREVAPCGDGSWGDIPMEGNRQHVDASYSGGGSDGSLAAPWTTIQQGVNAAATGAIVAVAAGTYSEQLHIDKPVRVWGLCPAMVTLDAPGDPAVWLAGGSDGSELHTLAVTGPAMGVVTSSTVGLLIDRLWVHSGDAGIAITNLDGPSSVTIRGSLVEGTGRAGILAQDADAIIEDSVVRDTRTDTAGLFGDAITIVAIEGVLSEGAIRRVVVERSEGRGIVLGTADVAIEATVVRGMRADGLGIHGISLVPSEPGYPRGRASIRFSVVQGTRGAGVAVFGSDLVMEGTVVRETLIDPTDGFGRGLVVQPWVPTGAVASAEVIGSVIEESHAEGVFVASADLVMEGSIVRNTLSTAGSLGRGISVHSNLERRANATVTASIIEQNHNYGIYVSGADITIEGSVIRDTSTSPAYDVARGLAVQSHTVTGERGSAVVRASRIERASEVGILVAQSDVRIETVLVSDIRANNAGRFGDGIIAVAVDDEASVDLWASVIDTGVRAAIANFGSVLELDSSFLLCYPIDLNGEQSSGQPYIFDDRGNNGCGCPTPDTPCQLLSAGLESPDPLGAPSP